MRGSTAARLLWLTPCAVDAASAHRVRFALTDRKFVAPLVLMVFSTKARLQVAAAKALQALAGNGGWAQARLAAHGATDGGGWVQRRSHGRLQTQAG